MMYMMAPDKRRWRLASGADLHVCVRYDGVIYMITTIPQNVSVLMLLCGSNVINTTDIR